MWVIMQIYLELHFNYSLLALEIMHMWNLDRSLTRPLQHYHGV
jgi:hypothetical protein